MTHLCECTPDVFSHGPFKKEKSMAQPSLVALYKILTWRDQLDEWKQISIQLDFLEDPERDKLCKTLLHTATEDSRNVDPIKQFIEFYMHPPRDAPRPVNTLIFKLNDTFAAFATANSNKKLTERVINQLDPSHLQFLMNNVSPAAQVVLCQQPKLRLYCEFVVPHTPRTVDDMYRISVDQNYHTLAPIFHWLLAGFPGSFDPEESDGMTFNTDTGADEAKRRKQRFTDECAAIEKTLSALGGSTADEKLLAFVRKYNGKTRWV